MHPFERAKKAVSDGTAGDNRLLSDGIWEEARSFLALAKFRSSNKAAEKLGVSHTTIARQIKRLEDVLGVKLVTFSRTGTTLTAKGESLSKALSRIDQDFAAISGDIRGTREAEGRVRVSITEGLGAVFFAAALNGLRERYPKIQIDLRPVRDYVELRENQTDMMVGFAPASSSEAMSVPLGVLHYGTFASRSYVEQRGMPTLSDLAGHDFIDTQRYSARGTIWEPWHELVVQGTVAHYCDASVTYALMVKLGLGIGLLPVFNRCEPSLLPLELGRPISLPLHAIALADRLRARHVRIVFDLVCEVLGAENPWLGPDFHRRPVPSAPPPGYRLIFNL